MKYLDNKSFNVAEVGLFGAFYVVLCKLKFHLWVVNVISQDKWTWQTIYYFEVQPSYMTISKYYKSGCKGWRCNPTGWAWVLKQGHLLSFLTLWMGFKKYKIRMFFCCKMTQQATKNFMSKYFVNSIWLP